MRLKIGLRQKDIAALMDVTPGEISRIESRKRLPNLAQIIEFEMLYGVDAAYLLNQLAQELRCALCARAHAHCRHLAAQGKKAGAAPRRKALLRLIASLEQ